MEEFTLLYTTQTTLFFIVAVTATTNWNNEEFMEKITLFFLVHYYSYLHLRLLFCFKTCAFFISFYWIQ